MVPPARRAQRQSARGGKVVELSGFSPEMMSDKAIQAFNARMFTMMTATMAELSCDVLTELRDELEDQNEKAGGPMTGPPAQFALAVVMEALRRKAVALGLT